MKKIIIIILILLLGFFVWKNWHPTDKPENVSTFEECLEKGYAVMESYPRQCRTPGGDVFIEDIGNILEKDDLIRVNNVFPNMTIGNPLTVEGEARGFWFFEADFPVKLYDGNGNLLATGIATAQSDWMTEDFVPFKVTLEFNDPDTEKGNLILEKDNPSGLLENADQLRIPIHFPASSQLANPASVYCKDQSGTVDIRNTADGQKGFCLFDDGSECEEWDFFRGDCEKGQKFCKDLCGDGVCQEIVCQAVGCPCSETSDTCPKDCQ